MYLYCALVLWTLLCIRIVYCILGTVRYQAVPLMVYCVLCMVCATLCTVFCALCMLYYLCTVQAPGGRPHQEYALEDRAGPLLAQAPLWHRSQTGPRGRRSPGWGRGRTRVVPMTQTTPSKGSRVRLGRRDTLTRREVAVSTPAGPGSHTANGSGKQNQ